MLGLPFRAVHPAYPAATAPKVGPVAAGLDGSGPLCPALVFCRFFIHPRARPGPRGGAARVLARLLPSTLVPRRLALPAAIYLSALSARLRPRPVDGGLRRLHAPEAPLLAVR